MNLAEPYDYIPFTQEMLEAPARRVLTLAGHRVLSRIQIEHAERGDKENGRLLITRADFCEYSRMGRRSVALAIREVCALGLTEQTGPNLFRLHYLPTKGCKPWKKIATRQEAKAIKAKARAAKPERLLMAG